MVWRAHRHLCTLRSKWEMRNGAFIRGLTFSPKMITVVPRLVVHFKSGGSDFKVHLCCDTWTPQDWNNPPKIPRIFSMCVSFFLSFFLFAESSVTIIALTCQVHYSFHIVQKRKRKKSFQKAWRTQVYVLSPPGLWDCEGDLTVKGKRGCDIPSTFIYFLFLNVFVGMVYQTDPYPPRRPLSQPKIAPWPQPKGRSEIEITMRREGKKKRKRSEVIGFSCWQQTGTQKIWETCVCLFHKALISCFISSSTCGWLPAGLVVLVLGADITPLESYTHSHTHRMDNTWPNKPFTLELNLIFQSSWYLFEKKIFI